MKNPFKSAKFWIFVGGAASGVFARSKTARKICVNGIAAGMQAKDCVQEGMQNIRDEASDIYADAKEKAAPADAEQEEEA